jgi:hypothetical protein
VASLPATHRVVLQYLCEFLAEVAANAGANRMKASSLAVVWSPNLVRARDESPQSMLAHTKLRTRALLTLIEQHARVFPEPLPF